MKKPKRKPNDFQVKMKEYWKVRLLEGTNPHVLYNFLSNKYIVSWYFSDYVFKRLSKSHELII
jgi:hypothetical protein